MKFFRKLAMAVGICLAGAMAQAADLDGGVAWLQAQQQSSGAYDSGNSMALPPQATSEALGTFSACGVSGNYSAPLAFLNAQESPNTEWLARRIIAAAQTGVAVTPALTQTLLSYQNKDGGFGALQGYDSHALDTAWAVKALYLAGQGSSQGAKNALSWLLNKQRSGGDWLNGGDEGADNLILTAQAIDAVWHYRNLYEVRSTLDKGRQWLMQQQTGGTWAGADNTAWALKAILPGLADTSTVQNALAALEQEQQVNGSWAGDVYLTALALQALKAGSSGSGGGGGGGATPSPNPDLVSLRGRVLDADTGLPVSAASVALQTLNLSTATDSSGYFAFDGLDAGTETVLIQAPGYLSLKGEITLLSGDVIDFGDILMKAATAANIQKVTISGIAYYSDNGIDFSPASGAKITVGSQSVLSNSAGEYILENIDPGSISLSASYGAAGTYKNIDVNFDALAGQQVHFDPRFLRTGTVSPDEQQSTLHVFVTDNATGIPIESASVRLNGITRTTDVDGKAIFKTGVLNGENTVTISDGGYESRIITFDVQSSYSIQLPVTLQAVPPTQQETTLQGVITDVQTHIPLAGATITLEDAGLSTTTDADGAYSIASPPDFDGRQKVVIEKQGYISHSQYLNIETGRVHQFDVPLQQQPQNLTQPIEIVFTVVDSVSLQPVPNAQITLNGSNPHVFYTDAAGEVSASGFNPGLTNFEVSAAGFDSVAFSVDLKEHHGYRIPVQLTPNQVQGTERIYGKVMDAQSRRPLSGARVTLAGADILETTTDSNGNYEFSGIVVGNWNISATFTDYKGSSKSYSISGSTRIDVALNVDYGIHTGGDSSLRTIVAAHMNNTGGGAGYLFIFGKAGVSGSVLSLDKKINYDFLIDSSGVAEIYIPSSQFLSAVNKIEGKALFVYADSSISAYFLNREVYTTDMSYLLDVSALGAEYRILSWATRSSQMSITAVEDGTTATIIPSRDLSSGQKAGESFVVNLDKGQSVYYVGKTGTTDLTGTSIVASKNVAVFSGESCANIPSNASACDHIFSQLPPLKHWDVEYIIPKTANTGNAGNLVRILAASDATELVINGAPLPTMSAGEFHQIDSAGDLHITSNHPVLVTQYLKGMQVTGFGDPAFTFIPGIKQTLRDYSFTAPVNLAAYAQNYLNLAIPDDALGSLELNGQPVDTSSFRPVGSMGYSAGSILVEPNPGRVSASKPFLATISGFSTYDSYHTIIGVNYSTGASSLDPLLTSLVVNTDQPQYPAATPVQLLASIANEGDTSASLQIVLHITNSSGQEVIRFDAHGLGTVQSGSVVAHSQAWDTATYMAGTYTLIGTLYNSKGEVVNTASSFFAILPAQDGQAQATLRVRTDRHEYSPTAQVLISAVATNLSGNHQIEGAWVAFSVTAPGGAEVFNTSRTIGTLPSGGLNSFSLPQTLLAAPSGIYTLTGKLYDGNNQLLASDVAVYSVNEGGAGAIYGLSGTVSLSKTDLRTAGERLTRSDTVRNNGAAALNNLRIIRVVISDDDMSTSNLLQTTLTLNAGQNQPWPDVAVNTRSLAQGSYTAALVAEVNGQQVVLDSKRFTIASAKGAGAGMQGGLLTTGATIVDGNVWVWGFRGSSQQGNGTMVVANNKPPARVESLSDVIALTGGAYHLIALDANGDVYGWGQSGYGETGCAPTQGIYVSTPCKVMGNAVQVAAGEYFSMALDADGQVWTWGHDLYGQLGIGVRGSQYNTRIPQAVNLHGEKARLIGGAYEGAFAVTEEGRVWAWGDNEASGLGFQGSNYGVQRIEPTPVHVTLLDAYADRITYIAGGNGWGQALLDDGTVIGWGLHAAIGQGTTRTNISGPEPVTVLGSVQQLYSRYVGSVALTHDGEIYTWGQTGGSAFPMIYGASPTLRAPFSGNVVEVGGGKEHIFYRTEDGQTYGVGYNDLYKIDQSRCCAPIIDWPGRHIQTTAP